MLFVFCSFFLLWFFFFFQAEDGIRDLTVTGVQTCALPIWAPSPAPNAPTPGSTTRAPSCTTPSSPVTTTFAPRRRNALAIDARFATPESTMTTSVIAPPLLPERAFGGGHVVEAGAGHRLLQRAVERLSQRQRTIFGRVVVVDTEVALARQRDVEPGVATERLEQMVEEAKARLHVGVARAVEGERDRDRRLPGGAADGCGACGHGSSPSASSVPSRAARSRSKSAGAPGSVMRDRKSTRLNSSHSQNSDARFCLEKKKDVVAICATD